jgi:hypothetical protein
MNYEVVVNYKLNKNPLKKAVKTRATESLILRFFGYFSAQVCSGEY